MRLIRNKILCIIFEIIYFIIQIANIFLADIALYEVNEGVKFNWTLLLHNPTFWVVVGLQLVHFLSTLITQEKDKKTDEKIIEALTDGEISLIDVIIQKSREGDFKSANKAFKIFKKMEKKRR